MLQPTLDIALKEWSAVVDAIAGGRQIILLRKGGIHETEGVFSTEHRSFAFFPTWLHQKRAWLKPAVASKTPPDQLEEPATVSFTTLGEVTNVLRVKGRQQIDALADAHVWLPPLIDMRFNYKPHNPLYVLLVRGWRLPAPLERANTPAYAGCRSWVPLDEPISSTGATAAMDDAAYADVTKRIRSVLA